MHLSHRLGQYPANPTPDVVVLFNTIANDDSRLYKTLAWCRKPGQTLPFAVMQISTSEGLNVNELTILDTEFGFMQVVSCFYPDVYQLQPLEGLLQFDTFTVLSVYFEDSAPEDADIYAIKTCNAVGCSEEVPYHRLPKKSFLIPFGEEFLSCLAHGKYKVCRCKSVFISDDYDLCPECREVYCSVQGCKQRAFEYKCVPFPPVHKGATRLYTTRSKSSYIGCFCADHLALCICGNPCEQASTQC